MYESRLDTLVLFSKKTLQKFKTKAGFFFPIEVSESATTVRTDSDLSAQLSMRANTISYQINEN